MQPMQLRLIYVPNKGVFEFLFDTFLWELSYSEIVEIKNQVAKQVNFANLVIDFGKPPTGNPTGPKQLRFDNSNKFSSQIAEYLRKVVGSYQIVYGVPDGQNRK
jgi:hypothetical protein